MSTPTTRSTWRGVTLNARTIAMLEWAEARIGIVLVPSQGSYNAGGVGASAGTHDGGGAVDLKIGKYSADQIDKVVAALRQAGFAAWHRENLPGVWGPHIHAVALGDAQLSPAAKQQVVAYKAGRDGLAGNAVDNTWRPSPLVTWDWKAGAPKPIAGSKPAKPAPAKPAPAKPAPAKPVKPVVQVGAVQPGKSNDQVKVLQAALKAEGFTVTVDGVFGKQTRAAYQAWQRKCGYRGTGADGVPGPRSLASLGARHGFTASK